MSMPEIFTRFFATPKDECKEFKRAGGFSGLATSPYYLVKRLTHEFGLCGMGWGVENDHHEFVTVQSGEVLVFVTLSLWYQIDGKRYVVGPHSGGDVACKKDRDGNLRIDDESLKKAYTDAFSKCCSWIGLAGDIHDGMADADSKYLANKPWDVDRGKAASAAVQAKAPGFTPPASAPAPAAQTPPPSASTAPAPAPAPAAKPKMEDEAPRIEDYTKAMGAYADAKAAGDCEQMEHNGKIIVGFVLNALGEKVNMEDLFIQAQQAAFNREIDTALVWDETVQAYSDRYAAKLQGAKPAAARRAAPAKSAAPATPAAPAAAKATDAAEKAYRSHPLLQSHQSQEFNLKQAVANSDLQKLKEVQAWTMSLATKVYGGDTAKADALKATAILEAKKHCNDKSTPEQKYEAIIGFMLELIKGVMSQPV